MIPLYSRRRDMARAGAAASIHVTRAQSADEGTGPAESNGRALARAYRAHQILRISTSLELANCLALGEIADTRLRVQLSRLSVARPAKITAQSPCRVRMSWAQVPPICGLNAIRIIPQSQWQSQISRKLEM